MVACGDAFDTHAIDSLVKLYNNKLDVEFLIESKFQ